MSKPAKFAKPHKKDNWGYVTYWLGEVELKSGNVVRVKWPNRAVTTERLLGVPYQTTVYDHGKPCSVKGTNLVVLVTYRGCKVEIDVERLRLAVPA